MEGLRGVERLDAGSPITVADTEQASAAHGLTVEPGDAVLFHTGWSTMWDDPDQHDAYFGAAPGVGWELARWLADRDVAIVTADPATCEVRGATTRTG